MFSKIFDFLFGKKIKEAVDVKFGELVVEVNLALSSLENAVSELEKACAELHKPEPPIPPVEPPIDGEFINFKELPRELWASKVNGLRVGYVKVGQNSTLQEVVNNVLTPYENKLLRSGENTMSQRIVLKGWAMVYANGTQYEYVENKNIRPFSFDGSNLAYLALDEQIVDGINLSERPDEEHIPLYVLFKDVVEVFEPTSGIEWNF